MTFTLPRIVAVATTALIALTVAGTGNAAPSAPSAASQGLGSLAQAIGAGKLDRDVEAQFARKGFVDAIVTFRYADAMSASRSRPARVRGTILEQVFAEREEAALDRAGTEARVLEAYDNLPASFVRFTSAAALLDVLNSSDVTGVRANRSVPAATSQSLQLVRQPQAAAAGHTGQGTYVAVLDTGVDYTRSPFGCSSPGVPSTCRVKVSEEWDGDAETVLDEGGFHGTNVAGVVSSVAPGTKILAFDVFRWMWVTDENGDLVYELRSDSNDQLRAINRVIDFKRAGWNVVALNMSLGGGHYTNACQTGLNFSVARDWGILPVVAAGNSAVVDGAFVPGIASPACDADAVSVGAVFDSQQPGVAGACNASQAADLITHFSQSAQNLSLLAPGSCITAAGITMQGTSQAAPHVAGAVAVLAAAKFGSTLFYRSDAARIDSALRNAGPSLWDSRSGVTRRRLDVYAALTSLVGSTNGTDTTPPVMAVPVEQIETPGKASATSVPVRISWSATDSSGVAGYELSTSTNGASYVQDASVTSQSFKVYNLSAGSSYRFRVRARDAAGNLSSYQYTAVLSPSIRDESTFSLGGGWGRYSWSAAIGGTAISSTVAGDTVTFSFSGRDVALVSPTFSAAGRAKVYCDGAYMGLADLYASSLSGMNTAFWCRFAASAQHTMKLVLEGTVGRPRFDVDAFAVLG